MKYPTQAIPGRIHLTDCESISLKEGHRSRLGRLRYMYDRAKKTLRKPLWLHPHYRFNALLALLHQCWKVRLGWALNLSPGLCKCQWNAASQQSQSNKIKSLVYLLGNGYGKNSQAQRWVREKEMGIETKHNTVHFNRIFSCTASTDTSTRLLHFFDGFM